MNRFYEDANSLFVRAYDAFYVGGAPIAGDAAFYEHLARETGGPVLELACGTGRIALTLAENGVDITGVDISAGMLAVARRKAAARPASVRDRLTLIEQDMSQLNEGRRFGFVFVPARSFQHLLTIDLQRGSLQAIHRHLDPAGAQAYAAAMRGQVHYYAHVDPSYCKATKRLYNLFRLTDELEAAAYLRELFDEPGALLYQVDGLLEAAHHAQDPATRLDRAIVLRRR